MLVVALPLLGATSDVAQRVCRSLMARRARDGITQQALTWICMICHICDDGEDGRLGAARMQDRDYLVDIPNLGLDTDL
eukprot:580548-Pleurochrysis_carterae.AAC.4